MASFLFWIVLGRCILKSGINTNSMTSKQLNILLGTVLIIALGIIGYFVWGANSQTETLSDQNTVANANTTVANTNKAANTNQTNTDSTAGWKTYTSSNYSFTIKYPSNYILEVSDIYPFAIALRPPQGLQNELGSFLEISPVNVGRESVFDSGAEPSCTVTAINFGGRAAKECKETRSDIAYRDIRITNLTGVNWEASNEISFEVRGRSPALEKTYNQILDSFKFTK